MTSFVERPDLSVQHIKTVSSISDPEKRFRSKEGEREKYRMEFTDGYKAEFCPLVHGISYIPHVGDKVAFSIRYRKESHPDEIDIHRKVGDDDFMKALDPLPAEITKRLGTTAPGHALVAASNFAALSPHNYQTPADVMELADRFLDYILKKSNDIISY